jgi:hypothetical protein
VKIFYWFFFFFAATPMNVLGQEIQKQDFALSEVYETADWEDSRA